MSEFPDDANGDVLRRMLDGGDDLSKPRDIDFSVVFRSRENGEAFASRFEASGLRVKIADDLYQDEFVDVTVIKFMVPDHVEITAFERELEDAAGPLGGENDGWGCFRQN